MAENQGKGIPVLPEAEAAAARAKLRENLKAEFRKQLSHPYRVSEPGFIVRYNTYSYCVLDS